MNKTIEFLALALLALPGIAYSDAPARSLDAGTWVRQSFTVVPASIGECPSEETFHRRAWRRHNAEVLPHMRGVARAEADQEYGYCQEARRALAGTLSGDWTGLLSMQRFDRNDLPASGLDTVSQAAGIFPWPEVRPVLERHLGDTLRTLLATKSLERSEHLGSSQQQNSSVATKMRTQDVTESELALLRGSAHVALLRVTGLDVQRQKKGLLFRADFASTLWSFDPVAKSFKMEGGWSSSGSEGGSPSGAGSEVARSGRSFGSRILELPAFRFTTQILSGREGNWINPASNFTTNTAADLRMNRRFRYFENRVDGSGNTVAVPAGWGYLDSHSDRDSLWRLRHVGGIQPYSGLVLEEVPGDGWGFFSFTQVGSRATGSFDLPKGKAGRYVEMRSNSPLWELRFGARQPLGSSHSFLTFDLPFTFGDVHGAVVDDDGRAADTTRRYQDRQETGLALGWGMDLGWAFRHNIRRAFWEAGVQAGLRMNTVWLSNDVTSNNTAPDRTVLYADNANWLRNFEGVVTLHTGLSWSLTPWSGIGVQLNYDWLDGRSDWEVGTGKDYSSADWNSVPGRLAGSSRYRLLFQYVWK